MSRHKVFRKDLASFESRRGGSWSDYRQTRCCESIDEPRSQRRFWSNESQIDVICSRKLAQRPVIVNGDIDELGHLAYTCITRRTENFHRNR